MTVVHYRFLPKISAEEGQNRPNWRTKRIKLRKTLHVAGSIGSGKRFQENLPPGTSLNELMSSCCCSRAPALFRARIFPTVFFEARLSRSLLNDSPRGPAPLRGQGPGKQSGGWLREPGS
jgi:hypothetical protein